MHFIWLYDNIKTMAPRKKILSSPPSLSETDLIKPVSPKNPTEQLEQLRTSIIKEINTIIDLLVSQIYTIEQAKKQAREEIIVKEKQNKQLEEEQAFNTILDQKRKQAEFDEKLVNEEKDFKTQKETELTELKSKKEDWEKKETEYKELKSQVISFPSQIEKSVEETKKGLTAELKKEFDSEKKFLIQKSEFDLKLLQQQVNNLQQLVKQQEKDIISLKQEKEQAMDQMKELAVAVVKGKESSDSVSKSE